MKKYLLYFLFPFALYAQQKVRVETNKGMLEGSWVSQDDKIAVFKGIPYAKSTAGQQRWKAPVAASEWEGNLYVCQGSVLHVHG